MRTQHPLQLRIPSNLLWASPRVAGRREGSTRAGRTGSRPGTRGLHEGYPAPQSGSFSLRPGVTVVLFGVTGGRPQIGHQAHGGRRGDAATGHAVRSSPQASPPPAPGKSSALQPGGSLGAAGASCPGDTELHAAGYAVIDLRGFQSKHRCHQIWKCFPRDKPAFDTPPSFHSHNFQRFLS